VQPVLLNAPCTCHDAQLAGVNSNFSGDRRQKRSGDSFGAQAQRGLLTSDQLNRFPSLDLGATQSTVIVSSSHGCGCTSRRDLSSVYRGIKII